MRAFFAAAVVPLLLAATPHPANAQAAPGEATDPVPVVETRDQDWSLGAGLGWAFSSASFSTGSLFSSPRAPGVVASLERRLGAATWLAVGVYGRVDSTETETGSGLPASSKTDVREGAVTLGLRQVVTPPRAPLAVSLVVLGSAAEGNYEVEPGPSGGGGLVGIRQRARATAFGASFGLAVDRELTAGLSLRLATGLAGVGWSRSRTMIYDTTASNPWTRSHGWSAGVQLSPSLELRLAF